jgi:hypothetical protein
MPFDGTPPRDDRPERYERELVLAIMEAERTFLMWQRLGVDIRAVTASPGRDPAKELGVDRKQRRKRGSARTARSPKRKPSA